LLTVAGNCIVSAEPWSPTSMDPSSRWRCFACSNAGAHDGAVAHVRRLAGLGAVLAPSSAAGLLHGHDGTDQLLWSQTNPRPLPDWTPPQRAKHEQLMRRAFELAKQAVDNGNCPYAGILATTVEPDGSGGEIVLEHCNGVKGKDGPGQYLGTPGLPDLTDHGESGAIRAASALLPHDQLATLTLYTSTEPCAMCSVAIFWAGCPTMIYGTPGPARGGTTAVSSAPRGSLEIQRFALTDRAAWWLCGWSACLRVVCLQQRSETCPATWTRSRLTVATTVRSARQLRWEVGESIRGEFSTAFQTRTA